MEPFQSEPDFEKHNDILKKEIEKTQKHLMTMKQHKFRQNLDDFEKGKVFDPTVPKGCSQSRRNRNRSTTLTRNRQYSSGSENSDTIKMVDFVLTDETGVADLGPLGEFPKEEGRLDIKGRGRERGTGGSTRGTTRKTQKQMSTCSTKY